MFKGEFERMPCGALPSALYWTEAASNTCCDSETPTVWSFDSLRHMTVTCILKNKCHMACDVQYFRLSFNKRQYYWESVHKFRSILHIEKDDRCLFWESHQTLSEHNVVSFMLEQVVHTVIRLMIPADRCGLSVSHTTHLSHEQTVEFCLA
jgi:hypothetical protein